MSLRTRLIAATIFVALMALTIAGFATYNVFSRSQLRQIDDTLQRTHEPIESAVADQGSADVQRAIEQIAPGAYVALQSADGTIEFTITAREPGHDAISADLDDVVPPVGQQSVGYDVPAFRTVDSTTTGTQVRVRVSRLSDRRILVIGQSLHEVSESQRRLVEIELVVAAVALLVAGIIGWFLVRIGLKPLQRVEQTALQIADGDLDRVVPGADQPTEVGHMATALNTMLGRIRDAFSERDSTEEALRHSEEKMRQFVADVSHELRTPLAAVSAYTELFGRGLRDHPADLERAMRGIDLEAARMHELVEELLLLARLDEGRQLAQVRVDLNEVVFEAISAARAMDPGHPITLRASDVIVMSGDPGRMRQVIDNLLANVRTHTPIGTTTAIALDARCGKAVVTISDDGPGMSTANADRIFERFYRADASRSRSSGGSGLGMAIVQAIVEAHRGTISVRTAPDAGLTVTISLPLLQRDDAARDGGLFEAEASVS
jgi:signal transduction histidine kinase